MDDQIWIAIRDGEIVGTPYGPELPNGKYLLVEKLDSEGGGRPNVASALYQYLNDLRHPPSSDSVPRRIAMVEKVLGAFSQCKVAGSIPTTERPEDKLAAANAREAGAYRDGWRFAYLQCLATGSVPDPDYKVGA